jgi:hypothetical protein
LFRENIDSTGINFPGGDVGVTYAFYSIDTDNTGYREPQKNGGENTITVQSQPNICPGSNTTFTFETPGNGYSFQWQGDIGSGFININNSSVYSGAATNNLQ